MIPVAKPAARLAWGNYRGKIGVLYSPRIMDTRVDTSDEASTTAKALPRAAFPNHHP